jgi:hypothetical protein
LEKIIEEEIYEEVFRKVMWRYNLYIERSYLENNIIVSGEGGELPTIQVSGAGESV